LYKGLNSKGLVVLIVCLKLFWFVSLVALTGPKTFLYSFKKADNIKGSFLILLTKSTENKTLKLLPVYLKLN
jgi:hypothetical protein